MAVILWTELALADVQEIYDYISKDSIKYADRFVDSIFNKVEVLNEFPLIGRVVPEFASEDIREIIYGNYRLVYEVVSENEVRIIRIHHSARLFEESLEV